MRGEDIFYQQVKDQLAAWGFSPFDMPSCRTVIRARSGGVERTARILAIEYGESGGYYRAAGRCESLRSSIEPEEGNRE